MDDSGHVLFPIELAVAADRDDVLRGIIDQLRELADRLPVGTLSAEVQSRNNPTNQTEDQQVPDLAYTRNRAAFAKEPPSLDGKWLLDQIVEDSSTLGSANVVVIEWDWSQRQPLRGSNSEA